MKNKFALLAVLILFVIFSISCECDNNSTRTPMGFTPDFSGTWKLTSSEPSNSSPILMTIRPSKREKPSSPGGVFMEGLYGPNALVSGTATGNIFVGTIILPGINTWAASIEMQMVADGKAQVLYRSTTSFNAVKIGR